MAYSRQKVSNSSQSCVPSMALSLDVSPPIAEISNNKTTGLSHSASSNETSWSPYRIRRSSYVIATATSPGPVSSTTVAPIPEQTGYHRVTDVDTYCPPTASNTLLTATNLATFATPTNECMLPMHCENVRRSFLVLPETDTCKVPSIASPLSDIVSPTNYDAEENFMNPENFNRMWNRYDDDGDLIGNEYDGDVCELHGKHDDEFVLNDSAKTPQRKNSYYEATQSDDDCCRKPEAEMLAQRILTAVSSNHLGCGSNKDGRAVGAASKVDGFWFGCSQDDDPKTMKSANSSVAVAARETEMILFPIEKDGLRAAYSGEADMATTPIGFGGISTVKETTIRATVTAGTTRSLVVISLSFVLVFSSFRSVQSLESSLNAAGGLGVIAMSCAHASMCLTCHVTPRLVERLSPKWTMVLGIVLYMAWIAANMAPHPLTLLPTALGVGFGQSLVWSAQVVYVRALRDQFRVSSSPSSSTRTKSTPWSSLRGKCRYDGLLLAGFQTSHVWGNIVSSILLGNGDASSGHQMSPTSEFGGAPPGTDVLGGDVTGGGGDDYGDESNESTECRPPNDIGGLTTAGFCGVYDRCVPDACDSFGSLANGTVNFAQKAVVKLMGSYLVFTFTAFLLVLLCLDRADDARPPVVQHNQHQKRACLKTSWTSIRQLLTHRTYRLLIPLLIFNGFEQGFVYADYTKSYVSCSIGVGSIGYNMVTYGVANALGSLLVSSCVARQVVAREALVGVASVLQLGLLVFLFVWVPDPQLVVVFFALSALWGICDALWQTQCTCLVTLTISQSPGDLHEAAFQNFRLLQGLGASLAFGSSATFCVTTRLYLIISLLIVSVILYIAVEYQLRQPEVIVNHVTSNDVHHTVIN